MYLYLAPAWAWTSVRTCSNIARGFLLRVIGERVCRYCIGYVKVLINAWRSGSVQLCGNWLPVIYFRRRSSFIYANICPIFEAFLEPDIHAFSNRSLPTHPHQRKALVTNECGWVFFSNSLICFIKWPCLKISFWSRVCSLLTKDTAESCSKSRISKFSSNGAPSCGMFIFVIGVYKRDVVVVVKMVSIFMRYTFSLWEAIIPIYGNAANTKLGNT